MDLMQFDIIKYWDGVKSLLDFLYSIGEREKNSRQERFLSSYQPLHSHLTEIHKDYISFITSGIDALGEENGDWKSGQSKFKVLADLRNSRDTNWCIRVDVRASAKNFYKYAKTPEERRYLCSVIGYFVEPQVVAREDNYLEHNAETMINKSAQYLLRSPTHFIEEIDSKISSIDLAKRLIQIKNELTMAWLPVSDTYNALKAKINLS